MNLVLAMTEHDRGALAGRLDTRVEALAVESRSNDLVRATEVRS